MALLAAALSLSALPLPLLAQSALRNSFPGRRIGGGTRGECSARLLAHLVPSNSVFAPGAAMTIGFIEGPTGNPRPIKLSMKPLSSSGTAAGSQSATTMRELPAAAAEVVLLTIPAVKTATVWESGYRCDDATAASPSADPLDFVQTASPPAVSLLVSDVEPADKAIQASLKQLRAQCGKTVPTAEVTKTFGMADVVTAEWPQQLPVRCP